MPSILDPLTCGFAKVRCYCIFTCNNSTKCVERDTLLARRYAEFCNTKTGKLDGQKGVYNI